MLTGCLKDDGSTSGAFEHTRRTDEASSLKMLEIEECLTQTSAEIGHESVVSLQSTVC